MAKKVHGICCICGQETELTFEHIPPRAAFNHFIINIGTIQPSSCHI